MASSYEQFTGGTSSRVYNLPFHNFTGTSTPNSAGTPRDPTVNDDSAAGYARGSIWINTPAIFQCAYSLAGAAVWVKGIFPTLVTEPAGPP